MLNILVFLSVSFPTTGISLRDPTRAITAMSPAHCLLICNFCKLQSRVNHSRFLWEKGDVWSELVGEGEVLGRKTFSKDSL